jgi:hypothetical protein
MNRQFSPQSFTAYTASFIQIPKPPLVNEESIQMPASIEQISLADFFWRSRINILSWVYRWMPHFELRRRTYSDSGGSLRRDATNPIS